MACYSKKLIIWDFDGVIADTEKLWLENRQVLLNQYYGLNWDFETTSYYLGGMSDKTRRLVVEMQGIQTNDSFWEEALKADYQTMSKGIDLTPGVSSIFGLEKFKHCIATGGSRTKTAAKLQTVGINNLFEDDRVFTADMVEYGKPEPDLFWLAAQKMGFNSKDCIVIEDSIPGLTAAQRAGMMAVAYVGCAMNNNPEYKLRIMEMGVSHIFENMADLKNWLESFNLGE